MKKYVLKQMQNSKQCIIFFTQLGNSFVRLFVDNFISSDHLIILFSNTRILVIKLRKKAQVAYDAILIILLKYFCFLQFRFIFFTLILKYTF